MVASVLLPTSAIGFCGLFYMYFLHPLILRPYLGKGDSVQKTVKNLRGIDYAYNKWQECIQKYNESSEEWVKNFNEYYAKIDNEQFIKNNVKYDKKYKEVFAVSKGDGIDLGSAKKRMNDIHQKCVEACEPLKQRIYELSEKLDTHTLIHADMFKYARNIANVLDYGRADTLKEAINIALEDERKADLAIREYEAMERQEEAMMRREKEQMRWEEEQREHNRAMEMAAERDAAAREAMAKEAAKQTDLAKKEAERAAQQRRAEESAARAKCISCANYKNCLSRGKGLNCGGFRPR